jgi:hypothetical protein
LLFDRLDDRVRDRELAPERVVVRERVPPPELPDRDAVRPRLAVLRPDMLRLFDAAAPLRPPLLLAERLVALPRPEPLFFPPPVSLFTVAHARRSASFVEVPRFL